MAYRRAVGNAETGDARIHELLYKTDHPRRVDLYIDFFGDGAARLAGAVRWVDYALRCSA
jgi:hypothetical protein